MKYNLPDRVLRELYFFTQKYSIENLITLQTVWLYCQVQISNWQKQMIYTEQEL